MTVTLECPNCGWQFEVEVSGSEADPSVGWSGGWDSVENIPDHCEGTDCEETFDYDDIKERAFDKASAELEGQRDYAAEMKYEQMLEDRNFHFDPEHW